MLIEIKDFTCRATVGVYEQEQQTPQPIIVNVAFEFDASRAIESDDITQAVDYEKICNDIQTLLANRKFVLLETLADALAELVMQNQAVTSVHLSADKPAAIKAAATIRATVEKTR